MSAVRNLNNTDCGGRNLRIDLADSDPYLEGKTTVHGEIIDAGETRSQWRQREKRDGNDDRTRTASERDFLKSLPQGIPIPPGTTALDAISHRLASMDPAQLTEVLAQMKVQLNAQYQFLSKFTHYCMSPVACTLLGLRHKPPGTSANAPHCPSTARLWSLPSFIAK